MAGSSSRRPSSFGAEEDEDGALISVCHAVFLSSTAFFLAYCIGCFDPIYNCANGYLPQSDSRPRSFW